MSEQFGLKYADYPHHSVMEVFHSQEYLHKKIYKQNLNGMTLKLLND